MPLTERAAATVLARAAGVRTEPVSVATPFETCTPSDAVELMSTVISLALTAVVSSASLAKASTCVTVGCGALPVELLQPARTRPRAAAGSKRACFIGTLYRILSKVPRPAKPAGKSRLASGTTSDGDSATPRKAERRDVPRYPDDSCRDTASRRRPGARFPLDDGCDATDHARR